MTDNNNTLKTPTEAEKPASSTVAGIRFRSCGKIYTFDVNGVDVIPGSRVVVDSEMGLSIGNVVTPSQIIEKTKEPLKKILRLATDKDFDTVKSNRALEDEAKAFCMERVKDLNLPMKIVSTETTMDKKRVVFYFTADGRIDFRELVRDLASKFKTRIEMRQIGVRDEVKLIGGFGCCGRQTCCSLFLTSFAPITIRMAKEQALSINQSKLSGICGRLMCCLGYEYRDASHPVDVSLSQDEAVVTVTEEPAETIFQTVDSLSITEFPGALKPEEPSRPHEPDEEKVPSPLPQEKPGGESAVVKKRFRRDHRRRKRHKAETASAESTPVRQPEPASSDKTAHAESKGKGRPFNKRRKFWKKKQK